MDFSTFSEVFFKRFRFFGVNPNYKKVGNGKNVEIVQDKIGIIVVTVFLVIYWGAIVMSFFLEHRGNDRISSISNMIQLILNGLSLTTILINTLMKYRTFADVISGFQVIDENLRSVGKSIRYNRSLITSRTILILFGSYLILSVCFDGYVTVLRYKMNPIWYWAVATLPSVIYSLSLLQSMFLINWISTRCHLINSILRLDGRAKYLKALPAVTMLTGSMKGEMQRSVELITKIYDIMSNICQLSRTLDLFLGPTFLTTITAIFAVTSIQVYYIYVTTITMNALPESSGFSVWSLMVSLNIVLMNIFLVIGITTICERVNMETIRILQNFSDLQINKEVPAELSIWLHPMISHMKFTAFGFFSIDYTMLCGFMTATITYLVIFIQFYSIDPAHGNTNVVRGVQGVQGQSPHSGPSLTMKSLS
ncbi:putative gustatory receptor 28b [Phlebotomus argentipes]|uniref:putative gustatory receptor 28b n=1 Tax=Phlebotomus argentipes TaxID=94469 RepID=UPI002892AED5|nr:putative gustatory receptor 28b [Phlebotomus argentipes]